LIRVGDKVTIWNNMGKKATVIELISVQVETWFVGGTAGTTFNARVLFEDGQEQIVPLADLMRID